MYREIDIRECVCKEKERYGREPVTIRVWFRMSVGVRVIWHFVQFFIFWHFVHVCFLAFCPLASCPDTSLFIFIYIYILFVLYYNYYVRFWIYIVNIRVWHVHMYTGTLYIVQCTSITVCTMYNVYCIMYTSNQVVPAYQLSHVISRSNQALQIVHDQITVIR